MRIALRPLAAATLTILGACGSITDPSGSSQQALAARKPPPPRAARPIVLFVHGYNSSGAVWATMVGRFRNDGWLTTELATFSYNYNLSNATTAATIKQKVDSIRQVNATTPIAIVTHSMGAMSARYYTRNLGGDAAVATVITLAGANHGTNTAIFCGSAISCQEMIPGSAFLNALNATDETWGAPRYGTWWSNCDEVINPRSSALLAGATNNQTACINHSALHEDAKVYASVRDFVNQSSPNAFIASAR